MQCLGPKERLVLSSPIPPLHQAERSRFLETAGRAGHWAWGRAVASAAHQGLSHLGDGRVSVSPSPSQMASDVHIPPGAGVTC